MTNELRDRIKNIYPTNNYALIELDPEEVIMNNTLIIPNTVHYETDGGKVGSMVQPKKYENKGTLLRCTNSDIERQVLNIVSANTNSPNHDFTIKVTIREKAVIEYFKLDNTQYDNIVIVNISDLRLFHYIDNTNTETIETTKN